MGIVQDSNGFGEGGGTLFFVEHTSYKIGSGILGVHVTSLIVATEPRIPSH